MVMVQAEIRQSETKSDVKKLRSIGKIPAVVYGKQIEATKIAIPEKELMFLKSTPYAVIEMKMPDQKVHSVLINEIQRDTIYGNILHVDFHQIELDKPVKTTVSLEISGEFKGEKSGGMLQVLVHELEIRCLPRDIPEHIHIDVSALDIGDSIWVKDLQVSPNVQIKHDLDEVLVTILSPQYRTEDEIAPEQESAAGNKGSEKMVSTS
ncbi:MAG: hypothetical protein A2189_01395 [Paenibacillus sp. RIFOXYA1_FULL_44_5]|nr:MAG: hypothetical protein A2189_01395 [Paenibacillus sp. RIFOXYA1_FULL_44_5]